MDRKVDQTERCYHIERPLKVAMQSWSEQAVQRAGQAEKYLPTKLQQSHLHQEKS